MPSPTTIARLVRCRHIDVGSDGPPLVVAGVVIADPAAVHRRAFLDDNQRRTPSIGTGAPA
jgi:hypothetical protein